MSSTRCRALTRAYSSLWTPCYRSMPLRAKLMGEDTPSTSRSYNQAANIPESLPADDPDDVAFDSRYGLRTIKLNRPAKLNSLDGSMARKIVQRLAEWRKSDLANIILIKGAGRAFCAGGDVAVLAKQIAKGSRGRQSALEYFTLEYQLDHLIAIYSKPYVAVIDGITMGGGVGLSVHAPFRIATENTVFAMPETTIGFFPDVGASFFLPRLDGGLGTYFALTSETLTGVDVYYHGVASHYLHSSSLPDLESRLAELRFRDAQSLNERLKLVNATIEEFVTGLPHDKPMSLSGSVRVAIDRCFGPHNVEINDILESLKEVSQSNDAEESSWASKTIETLHQRSPISVSVTLRQMREAKSWNIAEAFRHEFNIATKFMDHPDFVEGVLSRLVRKSKERPNWQPESLQDVDENVVKPFFTGAPVLQLLNSEPTAMYSEYPHAWTSLPREVDIEGSVQKGMTAEEVIDSFTDSNHHKIGTREKVMEVLQRKTLVGDNGILSWN